ncbi:MULTISPECIES: helix-turn-helix domain-containing protein [Edwardsiella]|uniref:Helix-turn-helix domain-containing protein n=1 Tax=Edwardsiella anguillarum TaxID=1821960 RepID=A0ABY8SHJ8_9GAMM|nr:MULTISPECIES: helix-turn-helix domain-containing protein [Edwardsiella]UJT80167.1 helix-turn-helix domain-containing protein [Edwardsiella piscicida]WHP85161.1 helix-turn-helix domain-containing protein [Edwardsiella anguillarum]WHP88944.1 helix-turn-helix domain-containing protein [Edwardsiella anguillarum]WHP92743.1 helix-turn-helix domain-containing protein [Edwardsiella anguillarum]WHP96548.1 helix-turn-helix domain-containing protein [Edwardsiella anguillarum]
MEQYSLTLNEACEFLGISRPTATAWIRSGRLMATRKNPGKRQSQYLTTRQACIAALNSPLHTVAVSAADDVEEKTCPSSVVEKRGTRASAYQARKELKSLLEQRTSGKLRSCTIS